MRISVPIVYHENVLPKGMQKVRSMSFGEWIDVEIKDVSEYDAPIAIQWTPGKYDRTFSDVDGVATMRYFDGALWLPKVYSAAHTPNEHITLDRFLSMVGNGEHYANPLINSSDASYFISSPDNYPKLEKEQFRRVDTDNRTTAIEQLIRKSERVLIVDGMVWHKTTEPVLHVKPVSDHYRDDVFEIQVGICPSPREDDTMPNFFRLDRMDAAIAFGKERWGDGEFEIISEPDIYMPEILKVEDDLIVINNELKIFVKRTYDASILDMPREHINAWLDLRDAIQSIPDDIPDSAVENAINKAKLLIEATNEANWYYKDLIGLIYRWDNKPIEISSFNP